MENLLYNTSHPWLTFLLDFSKIPYDVWMKLGEAQSKCEHIAGVPLRPTVAEQLNRVYLAKGAWATTAIEGNSLSEEDALRQLEGKLHLPPSKEYLGQEITNILNACNVIARELLGGGNCDIAISEIMNYNRMVLEKLPQRDNVVPGEIRSYSVVVGSYRGAPASDCQYLLDKYCEWLNSLQPFDNNAIAFNIVKAIIAHIYFAWIHPFGDGNGRTARLIEMKLLLGAGVPIPAAQLLTNYYNQTRTEYYRHLDMASKSGGDIIPFIKYAVTGYVESLTEQLKVIRQQQWDITWENYIHDYFRDDHSKKGVRMKHLMLDLPYSGRQISALREVSAKVAEVYAGVSKSTVNRDVEALVQANLIEKNGDIIRPNRELILAFLPRRRS